MLDEDKEDLAMFASYGGGSIDDPEAIARGRDRIDALLEEGENSGPSEPWNLEEFLATESARAARRKAA